MTEKAPTPAEIELMMTDCHAAGTTQRMGDGTLRTYYAGFSLTALAEHLSRELTELPSAKIKEG